MVTKNLKTRQAKRTKTTTAAHIYCVIYKAHNGNICSCYKSKLSLVEVNLNPCLSSANATIIKFVIKINEITIDY